MPVVGGLETEPDPRYGRISVRFRFEDRPGSTSCCDAWGFSAFPCVSTHSASWSDFLRPQVGNAFLNGWICTIPSRGFNLPSAFDKILVRGRKCLKTPLFGSRWGSDGDEMKRG